MFSQCFDVEFAARLGHRAATFRAVFAYVMALGRPVSIVETGCLRAVDNWAGDGQSTLLFDRFAEMTGSWVSSVDISPASIAAARSVVRYVNLTLGDSVDFLAHFNRRIDVLYLDSFDFDGNEPLKSATHHLFELCAANKWLRPGSIMLVDDTSRRFGKLFGKGMLIANYMEKIGVPIFVEGETQVAWVM